MCTGSIGGAIKDPPISRATSPTTPCFYRIMAVQVFAGLCTSVLLFLVSRDLLVQLCLFQRAIAVPCVLCLFVCTSPRRECRERAGPPLSRASTGTSLLTYGCCTGGSTSRCLRSPSVCSDLCMYSKCGPSASAGYMLYCTGGQSFWFEPSARSMLFRITRKWNILASAPADLCCSVRVPPHQYLVGSRNKITFVSDHTKPAVLCSGVRVLRRRYLVGSRDKVIFVSAHTKPAVLCSGVRAPHHRYLVGSRNTVTFVSAHTKSAVLCCGVRVPHHRYLIGSPTTVPEERAIPALTTNTKMESEPVRICQPLVLYA